MGREGSEIIPIAIYKQALLMLDRAVKSSSLYAHLRERGLDYSGAWDTLNAEIPQLMKGAMSFYPEIRAAYQLLPMFREWLVEDVLERNYQDVPDGLEAPVRHANDQDAPEWLKEALSIPAVEHSEPERDGPIPQYPQLRRQCLTLPGRVRRNSRKRMLPSPLNLTSRPMPINIGI